MAQKRKIRGIEEREDVGAALARRDVRPLRERIAEAMQTKEILISAIAVVLAAIVMFPTLAEEIVLVGFVFFWWVHAQRFSLSYRLPLSSGLPDPNDPDPAFGKPQLASGIAFLGNEMGSQRELWFNKSDMTTHVLVFGSTGAGKALRDEEMVRTPSGWARLDSLRPGDRVMTPYNTEAMVSDVFPKGMLPLWRLEFDDGRTIDASPDHLWGVSVISMPVGWAAHEDHEPEDDRKKTERKSRAAKSSPHRETREATEVLSTEELEKRMFHREGLRDEERWAVPLCEPLDAAVAVWTMSPHELTECARRALEGDEAFPEDWRQWNDGSIEQRRDAFRRLKRLAWAAGPTWVWTSPNQDALKAIQRLCWSLGYWARLEQRPEHRGGPADVVPWSLVVRTDLAWLPITRITPLRQEASCRCIKIDDSRGLFVTRDHLVTHNTETLVSMAYNTLVTGSGFIYVDGKGDNGLWAKIFSVARSLGREDDMLVINFMTGGKDVTGPQRDKPSNTMNPFTQGSAAGLTELLVGLMDEAGGDNAMWKGRAIAMIQAIMMALVHKRDHDGLLLGVSEIRNHLTLEAIDMLYKDRSITDLARAGLGAYLKSLPGYVEDAQKQSETVLDQHGYLQMQFTRILGSLSDVYGYIFKTNLGEVDFFDVVLKRRILVVLLPAMEKSTEELSNLGKIIVACLKKMMATGLGNILEGEYADVIETKPTSSPAPFMTILDEYGYYVVKGASVMPAQARSLGFCMVFAGQDYPGFKKGNNAEEAVQTIGNCNIKIFMKLEDPTETYDLAEKSIGKGTVGRAGQFAKDPSGVSNSFRDQATASIEEQNRANWLDFKDHGLGEAHIIFKSTLVRANTFFANPPKVQRLRLNSFLRVEAPSKEEIHEYDETIKDLVHRLNEITETRDMVAETLATTKPAPKLICDALKAPEVRSKDGLVTDAVERGMAALGASVIHAEKASERLRGDVRRHVSKGVSAVLELEPEEEENNEPLHAFRKDLNGKDFWKGDIPDTPQKEDTHRLTPEERSEWGLEEEESGAPEDFDFDDVDMETPPDHPFLDEKHVSASLSKVDKALGLSEEEAKRDAAQITQDMRTIATYPSVNPEPMDADDFVDLIDELESQVDANREDDIDRDE